MSLLQPSNSKWRSYRHNCNSKRYKTTSSSSTRKRCSKSWQGRRNSCRLCSNRPPAYQQTASSRGNRASCCSNTRQHQEHLKSPPFASTRPDASSCKPSCMRCCSSCQRHSSGTACVHTLQLRSAPQGHGPPGSTGLWGCTRCCTHHWWLHHSCRQQPRRGTPGLPARLVVQRLTAAAAPGTGRAGLVLCGATPAARSQPHAAAAVPVAVRMVAWC